jgi:hypothetical protein
MDILLILIHFASNSPIDSRLNLTMYARNQIMN